jgi:2-dehydro-3-deoxygluconokinase
MTTRVVTFGEIMLRLSPPGAERLLQSPLLSATFGGSEANVAVSLAHFGLDSVYVTALPPHAIGDAAVRALRAEGVQTTHIVRHGHRLGIYFAETGASQRPSTVIYDRAHSAIAEMDPDALDWTTIMAGAAWFHVSGITPALGAAAAQSTRRALAVAKAVGARVSFDLNYRRTLWTEAEAQRTVATLLGDVDLLVANEEDLQSVLGIRVPGTDVAAGQLSHDGFRDAAAHVTREFGPRRVAITLRESRSATDNGWSALLWHADTETIIASQRYDLHVVDRIGAGDSFAAGLIWSMIMGRSLDEALRFAVAAGALKHSIPGDFNRVSVADVERLTRGDASGRVRR